MYLKDSYLKADLDETQEKFAEEDLKNKLDMFQKNRFKFK